MNQIRDRFGGGVMESWGDVNTVKRKNESRVNYFFGETGGELWVWDQLVHGTHS